MKSSINLKASIASMHGSTILHTWTLLKMLFLSSKVFYTFFHHSYFVIFFNCSFSSYQKLSRFAFFFFYPFLLKVLFFHNQGDYPARPFYLFPHIFLPALFHHHQSCRTLLFYFTILFFLHFIFSMIEVIWITF